MKERRLKVKCVFCLTSYHFYLMCHSVFFCVARHTQWRGKYLMLRLNGCFVANAFKQPDIVFPLGALFFFPLFDFLWPTTNDFFNEICSDLIFTCHHHNVKVTMDVGQYCEHNVAYANINWVVRQAIAQEKNCDINWIPSAKANVL